MMIFMKIKQLFCKHRNIEPYLIQTIKTESKPSEDKKQTNVTIETKTITKWRCRYCGKILNSPPSYK